MWNAKLKLKHKIKLKWIVEQQFKHVVELHFTIEKYCSYLFTDNEAF